MGNIPALLRSVVVLVLVGVLAIVPGCELWVEGASITTNPVTTSVANNLEPQGGWSVTASASELGSVTSWVDAVKQAKPSVVAINVEITSLDFFGRPIVSRGAGTGWIIDENGFIVTNAHVVEGASRIEVVLDDGRSFQADRVWADAVSDLAVIKIPAQGLPVANIYDYRNEALEVGEPVAALGNALGAGISMKGGWISRLDVSLPVEGGTLYGLIETDAAINPGNSGGPLINLAGEVIGITSAKLVSVDVEGVAYAIPVSSAIPVIEDLVNYGYVIRPFLGVEGLITVNRAVATYYRLSVQEGVLIGAVVPGSPADEAGLAPGDVIVAVDGDTVKTAEELVRIVYSKAIGQEVEVKYWRGDEIKTALAILAQTPPP